MVETHSTTRLTKSTFCMLTIFKYFTPHEFLTKLSLLSREQRSRIESSGILRSENEQRVIHLHVHTGHQIFPRLAPHALLFKYASQIHIKVDYCNEDEAEQAAHETQHILSAIAHHDHLK